MIDFFSASRRYDFPIPIIDMSELRGLTKSEHLNYIIKRLIILTFREKSEPVIGNYYVDGTILHTIAGDSVVGTKVVLTGNSSIQGTKLILQ